MSFTSSGATAQLEQELRRTVDSLNEAYIFDVETLKFLVVNRVACHNLGYSLKELHEITPLELKPEFTPESFGRLIAPLRNGQERRIRFKTLHRRKDGSHYSVEVHLQRSTFHGRPVFVAIVWVSTFQLHAEKFRKDSEACMQAVLDTAVEAVIVTDVQGVCESVNQAAVTMFGYSAEEIVGRNISLLMPSPYREEHQGYMERYLRTGQKKIIGIGREVVGRRKDGSKFPIFLSVSEVQLDDHRLFAGLAQDLTERKEAERRLVQSERLAAVGEAMTSLAHESKNLLQKIQMAVEFGRQEVVCNAKAVREFDAIEKASDDLQSLLDEVRSYSAPIHLECSEVSAPELWREAWQLLERQHRDRRATLREDLGCKSLTCNLDRFRMIQVFRNLLENSLAACTDPVEISICASESHTSDGAILQIKVSDNGPGLAAEQKQRVFEPFFTTKSKGTGLGMAIAQRILEVHGGRIYVGDGRRNGAEFCIELPL